MNFISYIRVSTSMQGKSGLGMEAQQHAVQAFVATKGGTVVQEFAEIETGKGADALTMRPKLAAALAKCKATGAVLVIAKLDRLARNVHFISGLIESGVDFVAADMPNATKVMLQMHAVMSEWERDQISARTKAALAAAKARGVVLGKSGTANLRRNVEGRKAAADSHAQALKPTLDGYAASGLKQRQQVDALNKAGVPTPAGGKGWTQVQLQRVLARLAA